MARKKYVVVKQHNPDFSEVHNVIAGDELRCTKKETIYPGWIWCADHKDTQAWVPEVYVAISGDAYRMLRDYTSRELAPAVGNCVEVLEIESGWAWVRDGANEKGWLPLECVTEVLE